MLVTTTGSKQLTNSSSNHENTESIPTIGQQTSGINQRKVNDKFFHIRENSNGNNELMKKGNIFDQ